jgi:Glycosyltransferase family 9 (heptosyltransferase)
LFENGRIDMDLIYIADTINFKNPVFGEGILIKDKIYYAYSQFAKETVKSGIGHMIENNKSDIIHFEPSHLNLKKGFKKILLMFAGGLGDAVTLGVVLPEIIRHFNISFDMCGDKTKWDMIFKPMGMPGKHVAYPPDLETLYQYDAVLTDITRFYYSNDGLRVSPIIQLCRGFGINCVDLKSIYINSDDIRKKCKLPSADAVRIGVNLDSNGRVKSYPEKLYYRLLNGLQENGIEVYLLGIKKDEQERYNLKGIHDLRSKTMIPELAAVISQMDMVLGVDSFIIHLSNLLNKPTITLLSTTTPSYFEWHKNISCLSSRMECSPCFEVFDDCPLGYKECRAFYHKSISEKVIIKEIVKKVAASFFRKNSLKVENNEHFFAPG